MLVSSISDSGQVGISGSDVLCVSSGNISNLSGLESLLSSDSGGGLLLAWDKGGVRWAKWLLSIHGIESGVGDSSEWGSSSVHHVDSGSGIVPFLGVSISGVISVVFSNHSVVLLLESFLLSGNSSGLISGFLPGLSGVIRGSERDG